MKKFTLGIDFGTTKTLVSWFNEETGRPQTVHLGDGKDSVPTAVYVDENGDMLFGEEADDNIEFGPERYRRGFKMKLGRSQPVLSVRQGDRYVKYTAKDLTRAFLEYVLHRVEEEVFMGNKVGKVVITCPALFSPMQREQLREAAMEAGMVDVELASEPEAAGYAFCRLCPDGAFQGNALIVDWGGGTLDMALASRDKEVIRIDRKYTTGDETMGGEVFDEKLWNEVVSRIIKLGGPDLNQEELIVQAMQFQKVRQAKERLSSASEQKIRLSSSQGACPSLSLTRKELEEVIRKDVDKAVALAQRLMKGISGLSMKPKLLLLVGGTSQIPLIASQMEQATGLVCRKWELRREAVSLGAALLAHRNVLSPQKTTSPDNEKLPQKLKVALDKPSSSPQVVASPKREPSKPKPELPPLAVEVYLNLTEIMNGCTVSQVIEGRRVSIEIPACTLSLILPAGTVPGKGLITVQVKLLPGIDINKVLYEGSGLPVLQAAAKMGNRNMVRTAIRLGADVNANNGKALVSAAAEGHLEVVKELLRNGADVNARDGWALRSAASNAHLEVVKELLRSGADVNAHNGSALGNAAYNGHLEVVKELLRSGANVNAGNGGPLRCAAEKGHLEVVKELLRSGANVNLKNSNGDTALALAKKHYHTAIVSYLKAHGAVDSDCFITTAICEHIGKPDDCYELEVLREFRDSWLLKQVDGEQLVDEYYRIAPHIVERIKASGEADEVYSDLLERYIEPCVRLIEAEKQEQCCALYQTMVDEMKSRYL